MIHNSTTIRKKFLKIMTGSDLSQRKIPIVSLKSDIPGPVIWITACAHGDEVTGIVIIQELVKYIKKYGLLKGCVYVIPIMNPIGFENVSRHVSFSDEDLNRSFPGRSQGSLAERIAFSIFETIMDTSPDLVIDLHNDWINSIPYALIDPVDQDNEIYETIISYAFQSGLPVVVDRDLLRSSLSHSIIRRNVPSITLELGESFIVSEANVQYGLYSIFNIMSNQGMISLSGGLFKYQTPKEIENKILQYSDKPLCSSTGIIRFLVKPGKIVRKGKVVAKVFNVFGKLQESLEVASDAFLLGHSDSSFAFPGASVVAFGKFK